MSTANTGFDGIQWSLKQIPSQKNVSVTDSLIKYWLHKLPNVGLKPILVKDIYTFLLWIQYMNVEQSSKLHIEIRIPVAKDQIQSSLIFY